MPDDDKPKLTIADPEAHTAPPRNVVRLPVITKLNIEPDQILQGAMGKLECVVVVGYELGDSGGEFFASSVADAGTAVWLLERAIRKLHKVVDQLEENDDGSRD